MIGAHAERAEKRERLEAYQHMLDKIWEPIKEKELKRKEMMVDEEGACY